jgi:hypothetical protein
MVRFATLLGFALVVAMGCQSGTDLPPMAPTPPPRQASPTAQPSPVAAVPPLSGATETFHFRASLSYAVADYTTTSQYVLYETGAFSLKYTSPTAFQYVGSYTRENGRVTLRFADDPRWTAVGKAEGDSLEVRYTIEAQLSGFDDAVYGRSQ